MRPLVHRLVHARRTRVVKNSYISSRAGPDIAVDRGGRAFGMRRDGDHLVGQHPVREHVHAGARSRPARRSFAHPLLSVHSRGRTTGSASCPAGGDLLADNDLVGKFALVGGNGLGTVYGSLLAKWPSMTPGVRLQIHHWTSSGCPARAGLPNIAAIRGQSRCSENWMPITRPARTSAVRNETSPSGEMSRQLITQLNDSTSLGASAATSSSSRSVPAPTCPRAAGRALARTTSHRQRIPTAFHDDAPPHIDGGTPLDGAGRR